MSFFVQILLIFLFILSPCNSVNARKDSWHHRFDVLSGFAVVLQVFDTPLRREIVKLSPNIFKSVAKTCQSTEKTKDNLVIIKLILSPVGSESKEKFSKIWTKHQILFLKVRVTSIRSNRGRTVKNLNKTCRSAKKCIISGFQNHLQKFVSLHISICQS